MLQMLNGRASEQKRFLDIRRFINKNYYLLLIRAHLLSIWGRRYAVRNTESS